MWPLLQKLFSHYWVDAKPFAIAHSLLFIYFVYRWWRASHRVKQFRKSLKDEVDNFPLLSFIEQQIKQYADQGREFNLQEAERFISDNLTRSHEVIRSVLNGFVVIGLIGTVFSLFKMGEQQGQITEIRQVLSLMGIAFSASFFGLVIALMGSLFFFNPLRRQTALALEQNHQRLQELSTKYPPRTPESTIEDIAEELRVNVEAIRSVIDELREKEQQNLKAGRKMLTDFRRTTIGVISRLGRVVEQAQSRAEKTAEDFNTSVLSSLEELKKRFLEISESWRDELKTTIKANQQAASRLAKSSENLVTATEDVASSLQAVVAALERTKDLADIVANIERLTGDYLSQTQKQIDLFGKGLTDTMEIARTIPDEWFTMLEKRNSDLTNNLRGIVDAYRDSIVDISNEVHSKFSQASVSLQPLIEFIADNGVLMVRLDELQSVLEATKERLAELAKADISIQVEALNDSIAELDKRICQIETIPEPSIGEIENIVNQTLTNTISKTAHFPRNDEPKAVSQGSNSDGLQHLVARVEDIYALLGAWRENFSALSMPSADRTLDIEPIPERQDLPTKVVDESLTVSSSSAPLDVQKLPGMEAPSPIGAGVQSDSEGAVPLEIAAETISSAVKQVERSRLPMHERVGRIMKAFIPWIRTKHRRRRR